MNVMAIKAKGAPRPESFRTAFYVLDVLSSAGVDIGTIIGTEGFASLADFKRNGPALADESLKQMAYLAIDELSRVVRERDGGTSPRLADWRLLVACLLSCHSLRDAISRMSDFFVAIDGRCGFASLHVNQQDLAELRFQCLHKTRDSLSLLLDVIGMASIFGLLRWLVADPLPVSMAVLPYADACTTDWVEFFLPFPISTSGEDNAICFPAKFLDHPVMRSGTDYDAHGLDFTADSRAEAATESLVDQARRIMYEALRRDGVLISLDMLSDRLGLNRDSVRRQLKNAGSSYSAIKDSCRRQLGLSLLRRTTMRIEDVAIHLDYCDSDAFRRAVQEWVGMAPTEYRRTGTSI
jgi:AraC-like DNA-binding protein